jgi:hypothetical protein
MEIILNAVWLVIAVASYVLLVRHFANRSPEFGHCEGQFRSIIALSCVLAILFPIISLSDDLQEMQASVAEVPPSGVLIKKFGVNNPSNLGKKSHHVSFIVSSFMAGMLWLNLRKVATLHAVDAVPLLPLTTPSRAPPTFGILEVI